jgi:hypothetical protein
MCFSFLMLIKHRRFCFHAGAWTTSNPSIWRVIDCVRADADWADKQVVIVATYLPTGEFQANAVIRHDSAVNAALAAYYSQQQAAAREVAKAERDAEEQRATDLKKSAAKAKAAVRKNTAKPTKQQKQESQAVKVTAEKAQAKRIAANKVHANSLFEEALA